MLGLFCIALPLTTWESNSLFLFFIYLSNMYNSKQTDGGHKASSKKGNDTVKGSGSAVFTILANAKSSLVSSINEKCARLYSLFGGLTKKI